MMNSELRKVSLLVIGVRNGAKQLHTEVRIIFKDAVETLVLLNLPEDLLVGAGG